MKPKSLRLALLFFVALSLALVARLPLRWVSPLMPATVHCEGPDGSLWRGHCASLSMRAHSGNFLLLGDVAWQLRPARLLRGRLAADVSLHRGPAQAAALVQLGLGRVEVLDLAARGPLDPSIVPGVPANWSGELEITGARLRLDSGQLAALDGVAVARNLVASGPQPSAYGAYELRFTRSAGSALPIGEISDQGGPLQLRAQLRLLPNRQWQLDGLIAARATADAALVQQIQYLGSPDAQGLRPISLAGNY